jgi:sugar phosphate isomerase/epimerase
MKAALHSWSFREKFENEAGFTVFKALDLTAQMGFDSIEIMAGKANCPPGDFASDDLPYLKDVVAYAREKGISIRSLSTYNDFAYVTDESWRLANIAYIKKWLRIAADIGVPYIRMLTGYYIKDQPRERLEQLTLDGIAECVPVATECGTVMAIENHNSIFFSAEDILGLIDRFGPCIAACPDPSNWGRGFLTGEAGAETREQVFESAAKLAPKAVQSHLKIKGINEDGTLKGWGAELDRLIGIYHDAGYDGPLAFESVCDGDLLEQLPRAREIVNAAIERVTTRS